VKIPQNAILVVTSLFSILLLTLHITDDIVRGISKAESSNTALIVLVVLLYGTLVLAERRSGHVIMLLVGLFAAVMPVMHMRGAHYGEIAKSTGGFFFTVGGERGIRTLGRVSPTHAFQACSFNHSDISPLSGISSLQRPPEGVQPDCEVNVKRLSKSLHRLRVGVR
jgi:hypothetical protein